MKSLLTLIICIGPLIVSAQPDTTWNGRYTDNKDLTGYSIYEIGTEMEGYCFGIAREIYDETGMAIFTELGLAQCAGDDGRYSVEMENSDIPFFFVTFETDQFGNKYLTLIMDGRADETFFFNPIEEEYYTGEEEMDGIMRQYFRKDRAILMTLDESGTISFMLPGITTPGKCETNELEGTLELTDAEKKLYAYKVGDCVLLTFRIEEQRITVTEKRCGNFHSKKCNSWAGIYVLDDEK